MLIIDSNIWVYYFDRDAPEHRLVVNKVEKLLKSEKIVINTVIIIEVAHFLVKNLGPVAGNNKLEVFLSFPFTVANLDYYTVSKAVELLVRYSHQGIGGRDATILATAQAFSLSKIVTHDDAFQRVDWLEVIDPISR